MILLLVILIILVLAFILLLLLITSTSKELIGIVQQPNIPNFIGHEEELKATTKNNLIFYNASDEQELRLVIQDLIKRGANKAILNVTSEMLESIGDLLLNPPFPIVAGTSTVKETRGALPNLYYILTDDVTIVNKALFGFLPGQNTTPSVFLSSGTELYIQKAKQIALDKGMIVYDLTGNVTLTQEQKDQVVASQAVFISALNEDQEFVVSQIPQEFSRLILFVNLPPVSAFVYPPDAYVKVIGPSSFFRASTSESFVASLIGNNADVSYITLAMMPILVNIDWEDLVSNTMMFKGGNNSRDTADFTFSPTSVDWSAATIA